MIMHITTEFIEVKMTNKINSSIYADKGEYMYKSPRR